MYVIFISFQRENLKEKHMKLKKIIMVYLNIPLLIVKYNKY